MPSSVNPAQLPVVSLQGKQVDPAVLEIIPRETAAKFHVVAYEDNGTDLRLAVVYPEQLKQGFYVALEQIGKRIGRTIHLGKTDSASFHSVLAQYDGHKSTHSAHSKHGTQPEEHASKSTKSESVASTAKSEQERLTELREKKGWPVAPQPPLFQLGKVVAYNYLRRIPYTFSKEERIMSVDFLRPNVYWFITDGSNDIRLKKVLQYITVNNHIVVHVMVVKPKEFDDLLAYYLELSQQETTAAGDEEKKIDAEKLHEEEEEIERKLDQFIAPVVEEYQQVQELPQDVVVPAIQATILSTEEEKRGLAGFVQKIAQNFAAQEVGKSNDGAVTYASTPAPQPIQAPPVAQSVPVQKPESPSPSESQKPEAEKSPTETKPETPVKEASEQPTPPAAQVAQKPAAQPAVSAAAGGENEDIGKLLDKHIQDLEQLKEVLRGGSVPRTVAAVVSFAIHEKASDIHVESFEDEVRVRYRIDGQLIDIVKLPPDIHSALVSRIKILSKLRLDENRVPQDGRFEVNFDEKVQIDVRISIMPTVHGEKVVMRILDKSRGIASLENLGIEGIAYERLTDSIQKPFGICLATGPTGSGKSTSLYAILQRIATPNVNVITLEDPVEYEMKGINQSQVRPKIGFTFAEGLRSVLRQDPNIIMVGEIRDGETANMATQAALTGHLVLSTLHTNDAAGAIPRLTNMGIEPFLITSSINMAMAQRLVRKICQNCKHEMPLPDGIRKNFEEEIERIALANPVDAKRVKRPVTFYQGAGCEKCNGKGYVGRMGIYEVLVMSDAIEDLTIARASGVQIAEQAKKEGMLTLFQDGLLKALAGLTTIDEVLRETSNK